AGAALIEYRLAGASGLVDLANWFQLGASAEVAGRVEESLRAYAAARALYPDLRAITDQRIATLEFGRGEAAAAGRRWIEAETRYRASLSALASVPESTARTE